MQTWTCLLCPEAKGLINKYKITNVNVVPVLARFFSLLTNLSIYKCSGTQANVELEPALKTVLRKSA